MVMNSLFIWVASFSAAFFTYFLSNDKLVDGYLSTFQDRLKKAYLKTTTAMREQKIPYLPANGGLFIWIDLSQWLQYFDDGSETGKASQEHQHTLSLIKKGVVLSLGEVSILHI